MKLKILIHFYRYIESAEIYATTDTSFEEISLKFLDAQDMTALRTFLTKKFQNLRSPIVIDNYSSLLENSLIFVL